MKFKIIIQTGFDFDSKRFFETEEEARSEVTAVRNYNGKLLLSCSLSETKTSYTERA